MNIFALVWPRQPWHVLGTLLLATVAKVLQLGVPVVTAFQVSRLVAGLIIAEPLYRYVLKPRFERE